MDGDLWLRISDASLPAREIEARESPLRTLSGFELLSLIPFPGFHPGLKFANTFGVG